MEQKSNNIVDIHYQQTGEASATNEMGMREMQVKAYEARNKRFLLIKAPPASGKSRALMFIALDKLVHQGLKKVVVAVPEKSIGRSFQNTKLKSQGFFADWKVAAYFNLTIPAPTPIPIWAIRQSQQYKGTPTISLLPQHLNLYSSFASSSLALTIFFFNPDL